MQKGSKRCEAESLPVLGLLLVHPLLALFKETDCPFRFLHQAIDVDFKVFILAELCEFLVLLVFAEDHPQVLVRVRQDVEDVRRTVFQLEPGVLTQPHLEGKLSLTLCIRFTSCLLCVQALVTQKLGKMFRDAANVLRQLKCSAYTHSTRVKG